MSGQGDDREDHASATHLAAHAVVGPQDVRESEVYEVVERVDVLAHETANLWWHTHTRHERRRQQASGRLLPALRAQAPKIQQHHA